MTGKIIIPPNTNIWPHELATAQVLARAGHSVSFNHKSERPHDKTADAIIDGVLWEFKAPKGKKLRAIEKNLRRGVSQCHNIVLDSRRMNHIPNNAILREVRKQAYQK